MPDNRTVNDDPILDIRTAFTKALEEANVRCAQTLVDYAVDLLPEFFRNKLERSSLARHTYLIKSGHSQWIVTVPQSSNDKCAYPADIETMIPGIKDRLEELYETPITHFTAIEYLGTG